MMQHGVPLALFVALAFAVLPTATANCASHDDCAADEYCDESSACYQCEPQGCYFWQDSFDGGACPDKCRNPELECQHHSHCEGSFFCGEGYECISCLACGGLAALDNVDCSEHCAARAESNECQAHDDCDDSSYCDRHGDCYACEACWFYDDAVDHACPSHCRNETLECQTDAHCGEEEYCHQDGSCAHCSRCLQGEIGYASYCEVHCGYFVVPSTTNRDETTPMPSTGSGDDELSGEQPTTRAPEDMTTAKVTKTVSAEPTTGADAEPTTGAAAEPTTEAAAEPTTAAAAEPTTGAAAEPTTEAAAEPTTEAAAEPTTEAAAEPTTEAAAEPTTEAAAEHTTEAAAEPTTKAAAEHTTEAAAEPTTKAAAEPTTEEEVVEPTTEQDAEPSTVATLPTQGASSSTSAPASTDTVPDQDGSGDDSGDWGMEPSTTPAICQLDQCYACVADDFAQCAVCKNKFLLHNGACRETCPAGFEAVGKGQFNRFCREIQVEEPTCADEFCHDCAGNRSVCTVCSSGRYLHAGACLEHCPAGYEEVGRGNFNNECRLEALAGCADNECYSCEEDRDLCTMCKNGYFLHEDGCVASCPSGYEPVGRGNFGKYCQLAAFACADEFCHDCSADRNVCSVCGSGRFLFDGACLASCPAGYVNVGSGNYRNTCRRARVCADHCHSCDEDMPETCLVCRHGTYLLNGTCHTTCPAGYTGKGRGNFHNFCEKDRACQRGQDSCDLCDEEADQCVRCRDARYLHEGSCIDACPHTHMPVGRGNFNLECHERGVGCTALVDECYRCNLGGTACEVCKNGFALYNGYCAQTCPDGYRMRGSGNFNRACVTA